MIFTPLYGYSCIAGHPSDSNNFVPDISPASVMVGNMVQGVRLASAQGRDMGVVEDDSDTAKKVQIDILRNDDVFLRIYVLLLSIYLVDFLFFFSVSVYNGSITMAVTDVRRPCDFHFVKL